MNNLIQHILWSITMNGCYQFPFLPKRVLILHKIAMFILLTRVLWIIRKPLIITIMICMVRQANYHPMKMCMRTEKSEISTIYTSFSKDDNRVASLNVFGQHVAFLRLLSASFIHYYRNKSNTTCSQMCFIS